MADAQRLDDEVVVELPEAPVSRLVFGPDVLVAVSGDLNKRATVLRTDDWQVRGELETHVWPSGPEVSPDGQWVVIPSFESGPDLCDLAEER